MSASAALNIDPLVYSFIGGSIIPVVTGLITKLQASSGLKAIVALFLSAVVGVVSQLVSNQTTHPEWKVMVIGVGIAFATNVASYLGGWKAIGPGGPPGSGLTANFGLGSVPEAPPT
jgi:hypothetical protein